MPADPTFHVGLDCDIWRGDALGDCQGISAHTVEATDPDDASALLAAERGVVAARQCFHAAEPGSAGALTDAMHRRDRIRAALGLPTRLP